MILWWSQQDSNLRPLACESEFYSDYSLSPPTKPKHFKRQSPTCLVVLGVYWLQFKHKSRTGAVSLFLLGRKFVNSVWPRNRSGRGFVLQQTLRTQLMSYSTASCGCWEGKRRPVADPCMVISSFGEPPSGGGVGLPPQT